MRLGMESSAQTVSHCFFRLLFRQALLSDQKLDEPRLALKHGPLCTLELAEAFQRIEDSGNLTFPEKLVVR